MQLTSLFAAAGLAASTNAFLLPVPNEISEHDIISTLPVPVKVANVVPETAESQTFKLNCPDCPVRVFRFRGGKNVQPKIKSDIPSHLELNFSIDHAAKSDRLILNGFELYPHADPMRQTLSASLVPELQNKRPGPHSHIDSGERPLGFGLRVSPVAKSQEDNMELLMVDLQVIEVGHVFVDGIPNVEIKLIKTANGGLMIGNIGTTASETIQKNPMDKQEECTTLLCKWRAVLMQQFGRYRNKHCGGRPGQAAGEVESTRKHPGHQMHQAHRPKWGQLFKNIASHILLPIAVGIMAGVAASLLGMMVGTAIVCLWRTFVRPAGTRRHHRHGHAHKAPRTEAIVSEEKVGLMSQQEEEIDAPPAYLEEGVVETKKSENEV